MEKFVDFAFGVFLLSAAAVIVKHFGLLNWIGEMLK